MNLVILGSTGSIGRQALDIVRNNLDSIRVVGLSAHTDVERLLSQAREFRPHVVTISDEACKGDPRLAELGEMGIRVIYGPEALMAIARLSEADCVLNALVGAVGLFASYATLESGKRLALANKESLVVGGDLLMPLASDGQLMPVDSEHGAIFQCLQGEQVADVARLWLTCSGGPFRSYTREELEHATCEATLSHPTWHMGRKITVDSATLMNKGLEVIEAHHLFGLDYDHISVVVHPQSCIHSMVEFRDGSVKAHLGATDMRIPIQYALSYPQRWKAPVEPLDFTRIGGLTFEAPDSGTFRCLALAVEAGRAGGTCPAVLNAANEVAVDAFLHGRCGFCDIDNVIETALGAHSREAVSSLEQLREVDLRTRTFTRSLLARRV